MAAVLMPCPITRVVVATGQHLTSEEFEARTLLEGRLRCSVCQQVHSWSKAQVRLAELPSSASRVS